jgi:hypothetical protein
VIRAGVRFRSVTFTLALLAIGVAWITVVDRPAAPRVARPVPAAAPAPTPRYARPATANDVLARADLLALSAEQRGRLTALGASLDAEMAPMQRALAAASEDFTRFAREAQHAGRVRLDDVRVRTEDIQALSALVRERRARHAAETLSALTPAQREQFAQARDMTGGLR